MFDARVFASQPILDLDALNASRATAHRIAATEHTYKHARQISSCSSPANAYLQVMATSARADVRESAARDR